VQDAVGFAEANRPQDNGLRLDRPGQNYTLKSMAKNVIVYSTDPCSFCSHAKALLRQRGIDFDEVNLGKDPVGRAELVAKTGMMSFPQIVVQERVLGGFRELVEADRTGRLEDLLAA
jgi:glutaredoxin 3